MLFCQTVLSATLPEGLMLNLDLQQVKDGLIPSKTLYPLYVPRGEIGIETVNNRRMLAFEYGQGLSIPHSSLLDPDGREWIVSVRVFALSSGIILSQSNDESGFILYLKDGVAHAVIKTGHSAITLSEDPTKGSTDCLKDWVTLELRIKPDMAILSLNRTRIAFARLEHPFEGQKLHLRLGTHRQVPDILNRMNTIPPDGFTGGLSTLKIHRQ